MSSCELSFKVFLITSTLFHLLLVCEIECFGSVRNICQDMKLLYKVYIPRGWLNCSCYCLGRSSYNSSWNICAQASQWHAVGEPHLLWLWRSTFWFMDASHSEQCKQVKEYVMSVLRTCAGGSTSAALPTEPTVVFLDPPFCPYIFKIISLAQIIYEREILSLVKDGENHFFFKNKPKSKKIKIIWV